MLHDAIAEAEPDAEISDFRLGLDAVSWIQERGIRPEVVFTDIQMPGLTGLELAERLKQLAPEAKVVFVTAYDYAVDAYRLHAAGYIMKPVGPGRIREELDCMELRPGPGPDRLKVRCFGYFEVFWKDRPVRFDRNKTKELLACLVDREGAFCTAGEIITTLWENPSEVKDAKHYLRVLIGDLSASLKSIGMEDVLIRKRGQWAIDRSRIDCDYYRMLQGDMDAVNAFRGQYMTQYSWAELTTGRLFFHSRSI